MASMRSRPGVPRRCHLDNAATVLEHKDGDMTTIRERSPAGIIPKATPDLRSIEAFGFNAPILVDSGNRVVAGHGRLEAAKLLGIAEAPVIRLEHLSEQQAKAYMLADNKLTDRSS